MKSFYISYVWFPEGSSVPVFSGLHSTFEGPTMDEICDFQRLMTNNNLNNEPVTVIAVTPLTGPAIES